mgnify:CR=1 FL=1
MGLKTTKNFVVANAVENILSSTSTFIPSSSVHPNKLTHSHRKKKTVPRREAAPSVNYMKKADYGKVPEYLSHVKKDIEEEMRVIDEYFSEDKQEPEDEGEYLSDEERADLIEKLKQKWDETNKKYQKITHIVKLDTIGKVRRKEALEKELDQLVKDIRLLSQKRPIRVV